LGENPLDVFREQRSGEATAVFVVSRVIGRHTTTGQSGEGSAVMGDGRGGSRHGE
jgi:hypothetical protein